MPTASRSLLWLLICTLLAGCSLRTGVHQAWHGLRLQLSARPLDRVPLEEELRAGAALVPAIHAFGEALGLRPTRDHTRLITGAHWEPHVIVSSPALSLAPDLHGWGPWRAAWQLHYTPRSAMRELRRREQHGREVHLRPAGAWTSPGPDALLPSALQLGPGDLAALLLHEQTHGTLHLSRDPLLAEAVAGFIGREAARRFLAAHYGPHSPELRAHDQEQAERARWSGLLEQLTTELRGIVEDTSRPPEARLAARARLFASLHRRVEQAGFAEPARFHAAVDAGHWNTARLIEHQAYAAVQTPLPALLAAHGNDLGALVSVLTGLERAGTLPHCLRSQGEACVPPPLRRQF